MKIKCQKFEIVLALFAFLALLLCFVGTSSVLAATPTLVIHANTLSDGGSASQGTVNQNNGANTSGSNDGSDQPSLDGSNPMANVTFTATEISPATGYNVSTMSATNPASYTIVTLATNSNNGVYTGTTTSTGTATLSLDTSTTASGYYLVQQVTTSGGIVQMAAFITAVPLEGVSNVNVYPKEDTDTTIDSTEAINVTPGTNKSTDQVTPKQASVAVGQDVTWNLMTSLSNSLATTTSGNNGSTLPFNTTDVGTSAYSITDTFGQGTSLDTSATNYGITFDIAVQSATGAISNVTAINPVLKGNGTDYGLTISGSSVTISFTASGIVKLMNAKMALIAAGTASSTSDIVLETNVSTTITGTDGEYGNSFTAAVTNAFGTTLMSSDTTIGVLNPSTSTSSASPMAFSLMSTSVSSTADLPGNATSITTPAVAYNGVINLAVSGGLTGAVFYISDTQSDGDAAAVNGTGQFLGTDGNFYTGTVGTDGQVTFTNAPIGVTPIEAVDNGDGTYTITGVPLNDSSSVSGTPSGIDTTPELTEYYAVETLPPLGYDKPTTAFQVGAAIEETADYNLITDAKTPNFLLPFTGGKGILPLIVIATVLTVLGLIIRRRKREVEVEK